MAACFILPKLSTAISILAEAVCSQLCDSHASANLQKYLQRLAGAIMKQLLSDNGEGMFGGILLQHCMLTMTSWPVCLLNESLAQTVLKSNTTIALKAKPDCSSSTTLATPDKSELEDIDSVHLILVHAQLLAVAKHIHKIARLADAARGVHVVHAAVPSRRFPQNDDGSAILPINISHASQPLFTPTLKLDCSAALTALGDVELTVLQLLYSRTLDDILEVLLIIRLKRSAHITQIWGFVCGLIFTWAEIMVMFLSVPSVQASPHFSRLLVAAYHPISGSYLLDDLRVLIMLRQTASSVKGKQRNVLSEKV
jgi:hypothetical protein